MAATDAHVDHARQACGDFASDDSAAGHMRPQLRRPAWRDLSGPWLFAYDDEDAGRDAGWSNLAAPFTRTIQVPFPPESLASGIADTGFHPVVWYRRLIDAGDVTEAGGLTPGGRMLLHFGAVDFTADVWLSGHYLGQHVGGQTPFCFDVTDVVSGQPDELVLVVRAEDDPHDVGQPRGKQDWLEKPHGIWYWRTTGIWQPVWLEAVPSTYVTDLAWSADVPRGTIELALDLNHRPVQHGVQVSVELRYHDQLVGVARSVQTGPRGRSLLILDRQDNGQAHESLLWSPEDPRLLQACIRVDDGEGTQDHVHSYLGIRSVGWADGHFMLNDRPYYMRAVLEQGYWPDTLLAAPDTDSLRAEVQLAKDLGFNTVRLHQKVEDPRYLYWADSLGILVWGENPSAFEFSPTAVERMTHEWLAAIRRDRSHPSVVAWVPLNESWGVQHIAHDDRQLHYAKMLYHLTKSLDPSRLVISNDGWEHAESDILTIHDYGTTGRDVAANYVDAATVAELLSGIGPLGRRMRLVEADDNGKPVVVSEFGGITFAAGHEANAWGYVTAAEAADYEKMLRELFEALQTSPVLAGFCYTQLTDTLQEANGLTDSQRRPKLPVATIRAIVEGDSLDLSSHRRPKAPVEMLAASGSGPVDPPALP